MKRKSFIAHAISTLAIAASNLQITVKLPAGLRAGKLHEVEFEPSEEMLGSTNHVVAASVVQIKLKHVSGKFKHSGATAQVLSLLHQFANIDTLMHIFPGF